MTTTTTTTTITALVIPVEGPLETIELPAYDVTTRLAKLQDLVGGYIESLPMPGFINRDGKDGGVILNEDGKGELPFNSRATDFMVPGVGILYGDHIAGPAILVGAADNEGQTTSVPEAAVKRARLIEREAA